MEPMDPTFRRVLDRLTESTSRLAEIDNSDLALSRKEIALLRDENLRMRDELRQIDKALGLNDPDANVFDTTADCIVRLREERDTLHTEVIRLREQELKAWEENRRASDIALAKKDERIEALTQERDALSAQIAGLRDAAHYAKGCADLAMKHRDEAEAERDEMKGNYERACQTIALMHEAATGRRGEAPQRGVVCDVIADLRAQHLALLSRLEAPEPPTPEPCDPDMHVSMPVRTVTGYRPRIVPPAERCVWRSHGHSVVTRWFHTGCGLQISMPHSWPLVDGGKCACGRTLSVEEETHD